MAEWGCAPTPGQRLLLQTIYLPGPEARQAWQAWLAGDYRGQLEPGSRRLLPLVQRRLLAEGLAEAGLPELKDVYRRAWLNNQRLFGIAADLLRQLQAAGLRPLALKGAALAQRYYADAGLRPMTDFDVLVPADAALAADAWLRAHGWRPAHPAFNPRAHMAIRHSAEYAAGDRRFDLHWHVLADCVYPGADQAFWEHAVPLSLNGVAALALCPTDQLIHVCVHGMRWAALPPVRWAADAMQVMRAAGGEIDWDRLLRLAAAMRLSLSLHAPLRFLRAELAAPVPAGVVEALAAIPVTRAERRYFRLKTSRPGRLGGLPLTWHLYARLARAGGRAPNPAGYLRYLQHAFNLPSPWRLPGYALRRLWETRRSR